MTDIAFSIVLPCYNEASGLVPLLRRYREIWHDLPAELILVNNGSTDATAEILRRELERPENSFARAVDVVTNKGYGYGVMCGVRAATGAIIGISHADLQCDPQDLFNAYEQLREHGMRGALVKGRRQGRNIGAAIVTGVMSLLASVVLLRPMTDINAQPKVFPRELLEHLVNTPDGFELDLCILYTARRLGWKVLNIPVVFAPRPFGVSKWAFSLASRRRHVWATVKYIFRLRLLSA